jgi:hypothetical protein
MKRSGNVVNRADMLKYVNRAQKKIFGLNSYLNFTKPEPYLDTTSGTQSYTLGDSVRTVTRIYTKTNTGGYGELQSQDEKDVDFHITPAKSILSGVNNAVVYFIEDPGTTDDEYILEQYEWPDDLTSESVQLSVDDVTADEYLKALVFKELEEDGYGQSIYNDRQVQEFHEKFMRRHKRPGASMPTKNKNVIRGGGV